MLRTYMPCLPTRVPTAPSGDRWVHEVKHDGYRLIARKVDGRVRLQSKQGYDWSKKYPLIADALYRMRVRSIVLDGEAMCFTNGREDFAKLWINPAVCSFRLYPAVPQRSWPTSARKWPQIATDTVPRDHLAPASLRWGLFT